MKIMSVYDESVRDVHAEHENDSVLRRYQF